jgi:hypothetical protein
LRLTASKNVTAGRGTRIRASATQQILHRELLPASSMFVPRDCTSDFEYIYRERFKPCLPSGLYRDYASAEQICTMTAKTAPRIRSLQPYEMTDPHPIPAYGLRSTQRHLLMLTAGPLVVKQGQIEKS